MQSTIDTIFKYLLYLSPYNIAFVPALILQQSVGTSPKIGVSPRASKNITQQLIVAYGVQATNQTNISTHTILASVTSILI